jgi:hypothetical protein
MVLRRPACHPDPGNLRFIKNNPKNPKNATKTKQRNATRAL